MVISEEKHLNFFERNARFIVVLAIACGSISGILGKLITASSMAIGFYRLSMALPFFAAPLFLKNRDSLKSVNGKSLIACFVAGFFLFLHFFSWFKAVQTTTIASAVVLQSLHPLVVLLVTLLIFKEKVSGKAVLGIIIAIAGAALIAGFDLQGFGTSFAGDIYGFLAGTFYGLYFCIGRVYRKDIPANAYIFLVFFFCWLSFAVGMFVSGTPFTGYPAGDYLWLAVMALVCQIGSHALLNWCVGYVSALYLSTWATSEIVISIVIAMIVLSEMPTAVQITGAVITIAGLLLYNRNEVQQ